MLIVICAVLGLTACGGSSDPAQPDGQRDARAGDPPAERPTVGGPDEAEDAPSAADGQDRDERGAEPRDGERPRKPKLGPLPPKAQEKVDREIALARGAINSLIRGFNAGDASVCTRMFDLRLMRKSDREATVTQCRRTTSRRHASSKILEFERFRVLIRKSDVRTIVRFVIESAGTKVRHLYRLTRPHGKPYRIDATFPVKQPR